MKCRALIRPVVMLLLGAVAPFFSGCGTCSRGQMDGVCRGTKMDALLLFCGLSPASIIGDAHMSPVSETVVRTGYVVAGVADVPISLLTDTLLFPYDLGKERERISRRQAQLRPLAQIMTGCIPPGAQVLERPPEALGPYLLAPYGPVHRSLGEGLDYTIEEPGARREYHYPGEPGSYIEGFHLEDRAGGMHLLVVRVRSGKD